MSHTVSEERWVRVRKRPNEPAYQNLRKDTSFLASLYMTVFKLQTALPWKRNSEARLNDNMGTMVCYIDKRIWPYFLTFEFRFV